MRSILWFLIGLFAALCSPLVRAQGASEPVYVPLMIKVVGFDDGSGVTDVMQITASVTADPMPPSAVGTINPSTGSLDFSPQILPVELGRETDLVISSDYGSYANSFTLTPPPGYTLLIDGLERKTKSVNGTGVFKVRVLPALDSTPAPAGTATELSAGQVKWGCSLGSEKNGQSIGWIWLIGAGVSDWAHFFQVNNLYFEQDSDELAVYKLSGGIKRQIRTNEAFVDLVSPTTPAASNVPPVVGAAFELRFYHPSQMTTSGSLRTPLANQQPFVIYRILDRSSGNDKSLRIEKLVCDLAPSASPVVLRTEVTTLGRTGADNTSYTWTATGWTVDGQSPVASAVATWSSVSGGHHEVGEVRDMTTGGTVVARSNTDYVAPVSSLPRLPAIAVAAPDTPAAVTSSTSYYADLLSGGTTPDPAKRYRFGFPQLSSSTGGAWSAVTYIDPANRTPSIPTADRDKWLGLVDTTFTPFLDTPVPALTTNSTPTIGSGVIATRYDYTKDIFGYPSRVTLTESYRDSMTSANLIAKSTTSYANTTLNGRHAIEATRVDYVGDGTTLQSSRIYFREDDSYSFWRNQPGKETSTTGAKVSYLLERGALPSSIAETNTPLVFTHQSVGAASRIAVFTGASSSASSVDTESTLTDSYEGQGIAPLYLLPGRSTAVITYRDAYARVVRTESLLRTLTATWQLVSWENFTYNTRNLLTKQVSSSGDVHEYFYNVNPLDTASASGDRLTREVDALGVESIYTYDVAGRVDTVTRSAYGDHPALVTRSIYDAADRVVEQRVYAADAPAFAAVSTTVYDLAGRMTSQKSSGSAEVSMLYEPAARLTTETNQATLATKISETYPDGHPKRVSGTAVIESNFTYGFESDGRSRTEATVGPVGSLRKSTSWNDWLGRSTSSESPAPPGVAGPLVATTTYDTSTGLPVRGTSPGSAPTLTTYDRVGSPKLAGLDADLSGTLEPASAKDRITGTRHSVVFSENAWWATAESFTYATAGSSVETIVGKSWTRLTGLTGGLVGESRSWDAEGNLTRRTIERDRASRTVTTRTWMPGYANAQVDVTIDGLGVSSTAPDGLESTVTYDSLRRAIVTHSPRSGTAVATRDTTTVYVSDNGQPTTLVETSTDAENRVVSFGYDVAFRLQTTTNPDLKTVSQLYNTRGQVTHVYGPAAQPVRYVFDDLGQRIEQHTFRTTGSGYASASEFPAVTDPATDKVSWDYDPATGLLLKKTDPLDRFVSYTYDSAGRIATRTWARFLADGTTPLTTTPSYDTANGDLLATTYNDGLTPTVSTTYDRLGRPLTITDALGTRTFLRDADKPWRTIAEMLPSHYGTNRTLTWLYEEQGGTVGTVGLVHGRSRGYQVGTLAQPAALLSQTIACNSDGRLQSITSGRDNDTIRQTFLYDYTPNSRLVKSLAALGTGYTLNREWDPVRDLLTKIETKSGVKTFASYAYTHTQLGQRYTTTQSGEAFAAEPSDPAETTTTYGYDDRGQVTSALTGVGNAATAPAALIPGRKFAFDYDLAGNRLKSTHQGDLSGPAAASYTVGKGNQLLKRDNPAASVSGVASASAAQVTVDTTVLGAADRQGPHWQRDVVPPETGSAIDVPDDAGTTPIPTEFPRAIRQVTTLASVAGGGDGGADLASFDRIDLQLAPRDEQLRYDRDGNLRRDGTWDYTWDAENRLVRMETHDGFLDRARIKLEFTYDYQGRRVTKRVQQWPVNALNYGPATETRFLYDGWNLIGEFGWDASTTTLSLNKSYTWGLDLVGSLTTSGGVGALVQITDHAQGQNYLPGYDGNGNLTVLVRASDGFRAAAYEYGAFGELLRAEGIYSKQNAFRFSTKFTDVESGLVYYGMRYYDARNGRFINRDPIEERGGLNLYGFCGNDGVSRYDLLGMKGFFSKLWGSPFNPLNFKKRWHKVTHWFGQNPWAGAVVGAVVGFFTAGAGWVAGASWLAGAANGAIGGFAAGATTSALTGGSPSQIIAAGAWGALGGAVAGGIGNKFGPVGRGSNFDFGNEFGRALAHGVSQGGISTLRGQKFGAGFASGLFGSFAGSGLRASGAPWQIGIPASGVIGGLSSRIGGGRFEDGFATGATIAAFNLYEERRLDQRVTDLQSRIRAAIDARNAGSAEPFIFSEADRQTFLEGYYDLVAKMGFDNVSIFEMPQLLMQVDFIGLRGSGALLPIQWAPGIMTFGGDLNYVGQGMAWASRSADAGMGGAVADYAGIRSSIYIYQRYMRGTYTPGKFENTVSWADRGYLYSKGREGAVP
ncbi:MAG: RHS repeat-associated core domain-containing protein [Opitutaceae bacterium]|jgi:RHS repeat-associated protein